jgi:hypothetical protein
MADFVFNEISAVAQVHDCGKASRLVENLSTVGRVGCIRLSPVEGNGLPRISPDDRDANPNAGCAPVWIPLFNLKSQWFAVG